MSIFASNGDLRDLGREGRSEARASRAKGRDSAGVKVLQIERPFNDEFFPGPVSLDRGWMEEFFDFDGWEEGRWSWLLERVFPCVGWIRSYQWSEYLKSDLVAGLTVGTMLIPQGMSYSTLAGLSPIYGLYSSFVPVLTYALFGSSPQLGVGPVAVVSLLISNGLLQIVDPSESEEARKLYTELAIQLALMVGVIECVMGLLRAGWMIRFVSHSIVSGFTTASAIIIGLAQASSFLGYPISRSSELLNILSSMVDGFDDFMWQPFVMGSVILALLLSMKHFGKTYPHLRYLRAAGPLSAIVLGILFVKLFRPASISVVGPIPRGFPSFSVGFRLEYARRLLPHAALVSGVGILESVGIAKALAAKNGYEIDSNQELFGLGLSNLLGSAFSASPVTGSFSRSAVMNDSGAKTGLSGMVVFLVIGATLLFLTPLFADVPDCGLAAIVVSAVVGLLDIDEVLFLWQVGKRDLLLWTAAFLFTLFLGIEVGVLTGVALSLAFVIYESANPHTAILGRLPGTTVYRSTQQYPNAYTYYGIVMIRIDAPMYFANISFIKDRLRSCEHFVGPGSRRGVRVDRISYIVMDMSPVTYIDSSAVHAIIELYHNYKARGIQLALCNPNQKVMTTLSLAGIPELMGPEWHFVRVHDAVQTCISHSQVKSEPLAEEGDGEVSVPVHNVADAQVSSVGQSWDSDVSEVSPLLTNTS